MDDTQVVRGRGKFKKIISKTIKNDLKINDFIINIIHDM